MLVVEHDKEMMMNADHVIDIGPGAGEHGGRVVAEGDPEGLLLRQPVAHGALHPRRTAHPRACGTAQGQSVSRIRLRGANGNNLKNVDLELPAGQVHLRHRRERQRQEQPDR